MSLTSDLELKQDSMSFLYNNAVSVAALDAYKSFSERRQALGLSNPGMSEEMPVHYFLTALP